MADAISTRDLRKQAVDEYKKTGLTDILTYPKGEPDAVTITDNDMDGLQPGQYLSDNIIDLNIKYLQKTSLSPTDTDRFYFFSSFFFPKLLQIRNVSKESGQCSVDYGQLRKWTQGVDLFKKEYIFIPVIHRNHWSLILICHLTSLNRRHEESKPSPCIYHLDSMNGTHESFEREVKSYLLEVWLGEKYEGPDKDQVRGMTQALLFMRYVQPKVPQQDNGYNCGLYLMHNVEDILKGVKSNACSWSTKQLETCFVERISSVVNEKRVAIKKFILQESGVKEVTLYLKPHDENEGQSICKQDLRDSFRDLTEDDHAHQTKVGNIVKHEEGQRDVKLKRVLSDVNTHLNHDVEHVEDEKVDKSEQDRCGQSERLQHTIISDDPGDSQHDEELQDINPPQAQDLRDVKSRNMSKNEAKFDECSTGVLLDCMVEGGVYFDEKKDATCWDKISERIEESCSAKLTEKKCRRRFDTLKKAYRIMKTEFCEKYNKSFSESTEEEREKLRLATTLSHEWYEKIGEICEKREKREKNRKLQLPQSLKSQPPKRRKSNHYHYSENDGESKITTLPIVPHNLEEDSARVNHEVCPLRSSEAQMRDCEEQRLRLRFKNKLAKLLFTGDVLTSEKCNKLIVKLEDVDTGETVRTGPWASAKLEVVVLNLGLTSDIKGNWTEQEFEERIYWDEDILSGKRDIHLKDGEGFLGRVCFEDRFYISGLLELGVRVSPRNRVGSRGCRIQEARTEPFVVTSWALKQHYPPTLGSEVWTLQHIYKGGPFHTFCITEGIFTVEQLLRKKATGIIFPYFHRWEETWAHAMRCKPSGKVTRYECDGRGIFFNCLFEAIGLMKENCPFHDAQSLTHNEKEWMESRSQEALKFWNHVELDEELILPTTQYGEAGRATPFDHSSSTTLELLSGPLSGPLVGAEVQVLQGRITAERGT